MKIYSKTHKNEKALKSHVKKIKARGGKATVKGNTVEYKFDKGGNIDILYGKIDVLIPPKKYPFLNNSAKNQPEDFMIDDRIKIKNKKEIYKVVKELLNFKKSK